MDLIIQGKFDILFLLVLRRRFNCSSKYEIIVQYIYTTCRTYRRPNTKGYASERPASLARVVKIDFDAIVTQ